MKCIQGRVKTPLIFYYPSKETLKNTKETAIEERNGTSPKKRQKTNETVKCNPHPLRFFVLSFCFFALLFFSKETIGVNSPSAKNGRNNADTAFLA